MSLEPMIFFLVYQTKVLCIFEFQDSSQKLDPTTMPADTVLVELEIGPSVMLLYGSLLRNFMHLKVGKLF